MKKFILLITKFLLPSLPALCMVFTGCSFLANWVREKLWTNAYFIDGGNLALVRLDEDYQTSQDAWSNAKEKNIRHALFTYNLVADSLVWIVDLQKNLDNPFPPEVVFDYAIYDRIAGKKIATYSSLYAHSFWVNEAQNFALVFLTENYKDGSTLVRDDLLTLHRDTLTLPDSMSFAGISENGNIALFSKPDGLPNLNAPPKYPLFFYLPTDSLSNPHLAPILMGSMPNGYDVNLASHAYVIGNGSVYWGKIGDSAAPKALLKHTTESL